MKTRIIAVLITMLVGTCHADEATCRLIRSANVKTGSAGVQMKTTGYDFAMETPDIYGPGTHSCSYLRDETVEGQSAAVYREQYHAKAGSTDATIWISKTSGRLLQEEQDGDVAGKGKGHISYHWPAKP
ncbi:MAG: hypothetical protein ABI379_07550 [Rhodanobacter sp.]